MLSPWQDQPYTTKNLQKVNTDFIHTRISARNLILGVIFIQPREQKFHMQPTANHLASPILIANSANGLQPKVICRNNSAKNL